MNKQVPIHEEEDIYEVERIIGRKWAGPSGYRWLIKWSGYDQSYNTWESTQDVYGKEVLNEFSRSVEAEMGNSVLKEKCRYILLRDAYDPEVAPVDKVNRSAGKAGGRARSASTSKHGTKGTKKEDKPGSARGTPPVSSSSGSHNNGLKRKSSNDEEKGKKMLKAREVTKVSSSLTSNNKIKPTSILSFFQPLSKEIPEPLSPSPSLTPTSISTSTSISALCSAPFPANTRPANILAFEKLLSSAKGPHINICNDIDDEGPPPDFQYIDEFVLGPGVSLPSKDFLCGCECSKGCRLSDPEGCECAQHDPLHAIFPYDNDGHVILEPGMPIYECNSACPCPPSCQNRVVQRGRTCHLEIFKTQGKGWGVRATQDIKPGTFVERYLGEIITEQEAERRGKEYDDEGRTYLFDMDFSSSEECEYTIDAYHYGNVSHFFNHSCDPNLDTFVVFIDNPDLKMHHVAFFAGRDIKKGEELTFDYMGGVEPGTEDEDEEWSGQSTSRNRERGGRGARGRGRGKRAVKTGKAGVIECRCGSKKCRKWVHLC